MFGINDNLNTIIAIFKIHKGKDKIKRVKNLPSINLRTGFHAIVMFTRWFSHIKCIKSVILTY